MKTGTMRHAGPAPRTYRYNVEDANGVICCQSDKKENLCDRCRKKADGCSCKTCLAERGAPAQAAKPATPAPTPAPRAAQSTPKPAPAPARVAAAAAPLPSIPAPTSLLDGLMRLPHYLGLGTPDVTVPRLARDHRSDPIAAMAGRVDIFEPLPGTPFGDAPAPPDLATTVRDLRAGAPFHVPSTGTLAAASANRTPEDIARAVPDPPSLVDRFRDRFRR